MKAVRLMGRNDVQIIKDLKMPVPTGDEVLIKIGGAGVCHSDLHVIHGEAQRGVFTLGHENAGWVEAMGESVTGYQKGDAVVVYGPWGCGHCKPCQQSSENYCDHQSEHPLGGGLGLDGGMADYMLVPSSRLLIPIHDLDPVQAAPLTDAALTPYAAIKNSLAKLTGDEYVVVIGIGGLGHVAVQILSAMCAATIIACDVAPDKLVLAQSHGAQYTVLSSDPTAADQIKAITGVKKAKVVLDFVGVEPTLALAADVIGLDGDLTVVGLGGGKMDWSAHKLPFGVTLKTPFWGSRSELIEVIGLARQGKINIDIETYPMEDILLVYEKMEKGQLTGRAVLIP
ncbi:MAG: NAD(P)-dependent alcohol dehydrogenase [Neisseriaceae bacterium]|nr:NAD(P)-dependent alcohol dehydrogenase [Neisseriaceae bacterium]